MYSSNGGMNELSWRIVIVLSAARLARGPSAAPTAPAAVSFKKSRRELPLISILPVAPPGVRGLTYRSLTQDTMRFRGPIDAVCRRLQKCEGGLIAPHRDVVDEAGAAEMRRGEQPRRAVRGGRQRRQCRGVAQ